MSVFTKEVKIIKRRKRTVHKDKCQFCDNHYPRCGIIRHEQFCYMNPVNKRLCTVCNSPVKNYKSSDTCGYSCANKKFKSGPQNGNWKESSYRTTCFYYHKKECIICKESNIVQVHHMDENSQNNDPSNLIPLCPTHHQYWHSRYRYLIEETVINYVQNWKSINQCLT